MNRDHFLKLVELEKEENVYEYYSSYLPKLVPVEQFVGLLDTFIMKTVNGNCFMQGIS